MRKLRALILALFASALLSSPASAQKSGATFPQESVRIYRDRYGVPSIVAKDLPSAQYGLGYAMGRDMPLDLASFYKRGRGRSAEIYGKSSLSMDAFIRALGVEENAQNALKRLPPDLREALKAYCAGINRAFAEQKANLPVWVDAVDEIDVLCFAQTINLVFPLLEIQGRLTAGTGSNQFAVAPKRSADGSPILSADPHLDIGGFFVLYEFALYTPEISIRGATFPGALSMGIGHNDKIAWSVTNNNPALYSLFKYDSRTRGQSQYNYHGEWKNFTTETYSLKTRDAGVLTTVSQSMLKTAWGPVIPFKGIALSLAIPDPVNTLTQGYQMMKARSVGELRKAFSLRGLSMWNFVFADVEGNISYQYNANLPRRDPSFDWTKPVPGGDPRTRWLAPHSIDELPHATNPDSGLFVNCNSAPWLTSADDAIPAKGWAEYVTSYGRTTRYDRLSELIKGDAELTPQKAMRYATDTRVPYAAKVVEALKNAVRQTKSSDPLVLEAVAALSRWDKRSDVNSRGGVPYAFWLSQDAKTTHPLAQKALQNDVWTPAENKRALEALKKAAETVKKAFGSLRVEWGKFHYIKRGDKEAPCSGYGYLWNGDAAVVPNFGAIEADNRMRVTFGSSFRMIAHLKPDGVESWTISPYGDSTNPKSPHYSDQMEMYGRGRYKPTHFGVKNAIRGAKEMTEISFAQPSAAKTLLKGGLVIDGTGKRGVIQDVRIEGGRIAAIGRLAPSPAEKVVDVAGLAVAPGFLDAHSHADGGVFANPTADTQIRQGITTAIVGQDGGSHIPLSEWFQKIKDAPIALNMASFAGHGTIRQKVVGTENRPATPDELHKMGALVGQEMAAGALGLSSGLEYVPGRYGSAEELIALAKEAGAKGGIYISHVRNEDNSAFEAFDELIRIAREAHIPAQISHIKLGSAKVWGKANDVLNKMSAARKEGLDVTADVYPYTYWQSTIRVLIATEEFENRALWEEGLKDIGGAERVRIGTFTPEPSWAGKTLAEVAALTNRDAISVAQEIVRRTKNGAGSENVIVTAMQESDLRTFLRDPNVMICSDGGINGSHPRGAGAFPRILGVYARQERILTLEQAIHKMTGLTAKRMGLKDRGVLAPNMAADVVVFDPKRVLDASTVQKPAAPAVGVVHVLVNGVFVLENEKITGALPGQGLRK